MLEYGLPPLRPITATVCSEKIQVHSGKNPVLSEGFMYPPEGNQGNAGLRVCLDGSLIPLKARGVK
jgi:hypothetical protein